LYGPDPNKNAPIEGFPQVEFLKYFITRKNISVGDYTYYDDPMGPDRFEHNVLYQFDFIGDKLIIGCQWEVGHKCLPFPLRYPGYFTHVSDEGYPVYSVFYNS